MKIVVIGGSSGWGLPTQYRADREFVAAAPGGGEAMDGILEKLAQVGYRPKLYADHKEMLAVEKPDVVIVDSACGVCVEVILDTFAAGCRVLAEKTTPDAGVGVCGQPKAGGRSFTDGEYATYVELSSMTDNLHDNRRRAELLGLGGREVAVAPGAIVRTPPEQIGRDVFIGLYSYINGNVTIEDHVLIGPHCAVTAGHHKFDPATGYFSARTEQDYDNSVRIGYGSWLASNVTVTAGVRIGRANLICAGAVVTHDTPDHAIMAGVPAKQIGEIDPDTGAYRWFKRKEEQR